MLPNFHFSIERWRKNEEYGVWVSTQGRVRLIQNKEFLNIRINNTGYCTVFTNKGPQLVHRLVAYTWLGGKRNEKYNIDHINSNKRDNSVKNLRWIEVTLNQQYATYTQTSVPVQEEIDSVDCIEKHEQEQEQEQEQEKKQLEDKTYNYLKILNNYKGNKNIKQERNALEQLLLNKKIILKADGGIISSKEQLYNFLGFDQNYSSAIVFGTLFRVISHHEKFNKHYWTYEVVNEQ